MIRTIAALARHRGAPKASFVVRHPVEALRVMRLRRDLKRMFASRRVAAGLGAAILALPLGVWVGGRVGRR